MVNTNDTYMCRAQFFPYIRIIGVKIRRFFRKTSKDPSRDANLLKKGMIFPQGLVPMLYLYAKYMCVRVCCEV